MIVKGIEVERHNLSSIGLSSLRDIQATLAHNVGQLWGDVTEEKLLMKLISIEIKRQVKVENIKDTTEKKEKKRTGTVISVSKISIIVKDENGNGYTLFNHPDAKYGDIVEF